jgi:hypothetical protein
MEKARRDTTPIACNPLALGEAAWAAHQSRTAQLFARALAPPTELVDGYAWRFPADVWPVLAAFIDSERQCCPFLTFSVEAPADALPITLRLSGSAEAKAVIAVSFQVAQSRG